ncbi:hypothetical protein SeLEV6574_g03582 [Synchytrium endobioticum]|uniref:Uncharacterized protein n=1 Tax=Synchytrium endobioticum TaxID=286115 RepID=A0A507D3J0_9FUNG|nr:hypothetical protein SeLEV6574_g03582 [Synchytrium endobioticum]
MLILLLLLGTCRQGISGRNDEQYQYEAQNMEQGGTSEMWQKLYEDYLKLYISHTHFEETETAINSFIKGIEPKSLKWARRHARRETQEANENGLNRLAFDLPRIYHYTIVSRMKLLFHTIQNVYKYHDLLHPGIPLSRDERAQLLQQADHVVANMRKHIRKVNHYGRYLEYENIPPSSCLIGGSYRGYAVHPVGLLPDVGPITERAISEQNTVAGMKTDEAVLRNCQEWPAFCSDRQTSRSLTEMVELKRYDSPAVGSIVNDHMERGSPVHQSSTNRPGGIREFLSGVFKCIGVTDWTS